eukprot:2694427-Prymnesium_polylepis.1
MSAGCRGSPPAAAPTRARTRRVPSDRQAAAPAALPAPRRLPPRRRARRARPPAATPVRGRHIPGCDTASCSKRGANARHFLHRGDVKHTTESASAEAASAVLNAAAPCSSPTLGLPRLNPVTGANDAATTSVATRSGGVCSGHMNDETLDCVVDGWDERVAGLLLLQVAFLPPRTGECSKIRSS